jgi:acyl-CoA thioesterase I
LKKNIFAVCDLDIVTVLIGINDIGIMMNTRRTPQQQQTLMKEFSVRYEILIRKLSAIQHTTPSPSTRKLFVLEPFIFPWPQCYISWMPLLTQMSGQILKISKKYRAVFVPLQDSLIKEASRVGMDAITIDGIHLTPLGHQFLAEKIYSSITERF